MTAPEHHGPIISVRAFVERDGKFLVIKRSDGNVAAGKWCLPGGVVTYDHTPDQSITSLVKEKTGLAANNLDFLYYQDSPPMEEGTLHSLNMYFVAEGRGDVVLSPVATDFAWISPEEAAAYDLALRGADAIPKYVENKRPKLEQLVNLMNEAGSANIPVTYDILQGIQALPGFFTQLGKDVQVFERVRAKVHARMEDIQLSHLRNGEHILTQIESRTKEPRSIMEKMIKKGKNRIPRHYTTFDDLSGVRGVVSYISDAYMVLDFLLKHYQVREIEDFMETPKHGGYRGIHVTLEVPMPEVDFLPRCEVQIRTTAQHAWATKTRELTYKQGSVSDTDLYMFNQLSDLMHEADLYADQLLKQMTDR
jgi:8-oxo-dGTP diphosphatase